MNENGFFTAISKIYQCVLLATDEIKDPKVSFAFTFLDFVLISSVLITVTYQINLLPSVDVNFREIFVFFNKFMDVFLKSWRSAESNA